MYMNEFLMKLSSWELRLKSFIEFLSDALVLKRVISALLSNYPLNNLQLVSETRCLRLGGPTPLQAVIILLLLIVILVFRGNV